MSQNLSSAAVVIGALRVNFVFLLILLKIYVVDFEEKNLYSCNKIGDFIGFFKMYRKLII